MNKRKYFNTSNSNNNNNNNNGSNIINALLQSHSKNKKRRRRRREKGNKNDEDNSNKKPIEYIRQHINNISTQKIKLKSITGKSSQSDVKKDEDHHEQHNIICLLFIIIDTLPYENIWKKWIESNNNNNNGGKYNTTTTSSSSSNTNTTNSTNTTKQTTVKVFIHAKNPDQVKSSWVRKYLIEKSFCPAWGSVELTKAMVELARVALLNTKDAAENKNNNIKLLYASESCIPICTLSDASIRLFSNNKSWLKVKFKPRNGYNGSSQWVPIENGGVIPPECVCKADQWVAINRNHAKIILNSYDYIQGLKSTINFWPSFRKGCASDEMYFPTLLSCCGLLPNRRNYMNYIMSSDGNDNNNSGSSSNSDGTKAVTSTTNIPSLLYNEIDMKQRLTYVIWNYADYGNYDDKNSLCDRPETFQTFNKELVKNGLKEGCIFIRKMKDTNLNVDTWLGMVS